MDEDEVPPLEDMSEELEKLKTKAVSTVVKEQAKPPQKIQATKAATRGKQSKGGFGGFKKGFLNTGSTKPSSEKLLAGERPSQLDAISVTEKPATKSTKQKRTNKSTKDISSPDKDKIPYIKKSKASSLELPEVQEAMKDKVPFLENNNWVTEDLLSKVEKHPNLSRVFQDPNLSQMLVEFQKNPEKAMAAAKNNKEMRVFLQDFCSLMGDHFTELADKEEKINAATGKGATPLITEVSDPSDEVKAKELLDKPEIKELLVDQEVQTLLHLLKTNPDAAQGMSRTATPALQEKIRLLIQHGLLAVHP